MGGGGGEQAGRIAKPLENKAQHDTSHVQQSGPPLPKIYVAEGVSVNETPEMTTFWGGCPPVFLGGAPKGPAQRLPRSTYWNPKMSFLLRYGVTFWGLRFGHHVSERNVSTFHVSAAAKISAILARYHMRARPNGFDTPLCDTIFRCFEHGVIVFFRVYCAKKNVLTPFQRLRIALDCLANLRSSSQCAKREKKDLWGSKRPSDGLS